MLDLVVIGAGIQGAGVAQAAALQGWSVHLIEQFDRCAQGTSSKSSKLIHGGLRYLENLDLKLVYECLREKNNLLKNASSIVKPAEFFIPVYRNSSRSALKIWCGLLLYSLLSGKGIKGFWRADNHDGLGGLKTEGLVKVYAYEDAQTDDAMLTDAVLRSAQEQGAQIQYSSRVNVIRKKDDYFEIELQSGQRIQAKAIVNATGPWVNKVECDFIDISVRPHVDLVQGTHIVLNLAAPKQCYYLESPTDGRAFFVLPWKGKTMIGTTETQFVGSPEQCHPLQQEIDYLLESYNHYFPTMKAMEKDIAEKFSGLRVLPTAEGSRSELHSRSRETLLWSPQSSPTFINIYGGKLTSYRAVAEKVVGRLGQNLAPEKALSLTNSIKLKLV